MFDVRWRRLLRLHGPRVSACRLGYEEYGGARYCFEHGGFLELGVFYSGSRRCDRAAHLADGGER